MLGKNYLSLVNDAIFESNATLDPLTANDFENPPRTIMYSRFKKWVNDAYVELLEDRNDWRFRVARSTIRVFPRLRLAGLVSFPVVGDILRGDNSGITFTVMDIHTGEVIEGDTEDRVTVSVQWDSSVNGNNTLIFGEPISVSDGMGGYAPIGYLAGNGYYDFKTEIPYLENLLPEGIKAHPIPDTTVPQYYNTVTQGYPVCYVSNNIQDIPYARLYNAIPNIICRTGPSTWQLHPQPGQEMLLEFSFTKEINRMQLPYDVPFGLPEEYHDYLMWRAVAEYADFQRDTAIWARAKKHLDKFEYYLFRDQVKEAKFVDCAFTGG